ncbi:shikimate kinase [Streptomyces sp. CB02613]|nr:shikimate kinase [Streptomyces sp. CB02613]
MPRRQHGADVAPAARRGALNQGKFYPRFEEIVLFSAPLKVMLERIATRDTNPFGKTAEQRDQIVADTAEVEPLIRVSATVEISTLKPLTDVVDQLAAFAGPSSYKLHCRCRPWKCFLCAPTCS